ncbi:hypothetical protein MKY04_05155 [Lysinibacillus telephonicus]|uniref:hypothetical protein n=1 Tax=Lysinibacillus telephonicus TaxID=1714840 RepID=UPI0031FC9FD8
MKFLGVLLCGINKVSSKKLITFSIFALIIFAVATYYILFFKPKNSLELYQVISFAKDYNDVQNLMLEGYEDNFSKEDFEYINRIDTQANSISQFTLFEYDEKTYLVMTSPGTEKLKVLAVEELPEDVRKYFLELTK